MTGSIIASTLAYLNLDKAKKRFESAKKRYELRGMYQEAIDKYEQEKEKIDILKIGIQEDGQYGAPLEGVELAFTLQVGRLVGEKFSVRSILKVRNKTDKDLLITAAQLRNIHFANIDFSNGGGDFRYEPIYVVNDKNPGAYVKIEAGKEYNCELGAFPQIYKFLSKDNMKRLRELTAYYYGYRLFSSIAGRKKPMEPISGKFVTSDVGFVYLYRLDSGEWVEAQTLFEQIYGSFQYMGYDFVPMEIDWKKMLLGLFTFHLSDIYYVAKENKEQRDKFVESYGG